LPVNHGLGVEELGVEEFMDMSMDTIMDMDMNVASASRATSRRKAGQNW
jgi:hypothetical protein